MTSDNLIFSDVNNSASVPEFGKILKSIQGYHMLSFQKQIKHIGNALQIPLVFFIDGTQFT